MQYTGNLSAPTILYVIFCLCFLSMTGSSNAAKLKRIQYKTSDGTKLSAYIMRPRKRGRLPAIIALHGCSGLKKDSHTLLSRHKDWGERFVKWGYVVIFPDSHGSRNIPSLCTTRKRPISQADRVRDTHGAYNWLKRQSFINRKNISVLGWSEGAMAALRIAYSRSGKKFRQVFAFYPDCKRTMKNTKGKQNIPLTILIGSRDDWTSPRDCQKLVWERGGHIIIYDRAFHGFDIPNAKLRTRLWLAYTAADFGVARVGTNKKARKQSIRDIKRLLKLK